MASTVKSKYTNIKKSMGIRPVKGTQTLPGYKLKYSITLQWHDMDKEMTQTGEGFHKNIQESSTKTLILLINAATIGALMTYS